MALAVGKQVEFLYNTGLLSKPVIRASRPRLLMALGSLLGLGFAAAQPSKAQAHMTLFFPPPLVLKTTPRKAAGDEPERRAVSSYDAVSWTQDLLRGKEAMEALAKRIERMEPESKATTLRSAILLSEDGRIRVDELPGSCVGVTVSASNPAVARTLCEGLLAYLTFKTKIPLEDSEGGKLREVEQQLRVQEKTLSGELWNLFSFAASAEPPSRAQQLELDLQEYQAAFRVYAEFLREHFFREVGVAAGGPSFQVLEPPVAIQLPRPWLACALLGGTVGAILGWLFSSLKARRRKLPANVPWRVQEHRSGGRIGLMVHGDQVQVEG